MGCVSNDNNKGSSRVWPLIGPLCEIIPASLSPSSSLPSISPSHSSFYYKPSSDINQLKYNLIAHLISMLIAVMQCTINKSSVELLLLLEWTELRWNEKTFPRIWCPGTIRQEETISSWITCNASACSICHWIRVTALNTCVQTIYHGGNVYGHLAAPSYCF